MGCCNNLSGHNRNRTAAVIMNLIICANYVHYMLSMCTRLEHNCHIHLDGCISLLYCKVDGFYTNYILRGVGAVVSLVILILVSSYNFCCNMCQLLILY